MDENGRATRDEPAVTPSIIQLLDGSSGAHKTNFLPSKHLVIRYVRKKIGLITFHLVETHELNEQGEIVAISNAYRRLAHRRDCHNDWGLRFDLGHSRTVFDVDAGHWTCLRS